MGTTAPVNESNMATSKTALDVSEALNRVSFVSSNSISDNDFLREVVEEFFDGDEMEPEIGDVNLLI